MPYGLSQSDYKANIAREFCDLPQMYSYAGKHTIYVTESEYQWSIEEYDMKKTKRGAEQYVPVREVKIVRVCGERERERESKNDRAEIY